MLWYQCSHRLNKAVYRWPRSQSLLLRKNKIDFSFFSSFLIVTITGFPFYSNHHKFNWLKKKYNPRLLSALTAIRSWQWLLFIKPSLVRLGVALAGLQTTASFSPLGGFIVSTLPLEWAVDTFSHFVDVIDFLCDNSDKTSTWPIWYWVVTTMHYLAEHVLGSILRGTSLRPVPW